MKLLFHIQILFLIISILSFINGDKIIMNLKSKFPIDFIRINQYKPRLFYHHNSKFIQFPLEVEPGDKISLNIFSKNISITNYKDVSIYFTFKNGNFYFFNQKNISIINSYNIPKENNNLLIQIQIPYEIYCDSHEDIILNNSNKNLSFSLYSNVFINNTKFKQKDELQIQILDIYYSTKNNSKKYPLMNFNKDNNYSLDTIFKINFKEGLHINDSLIIKYRGINSMTGGKSINQCTLKIINEDNKNYTPSIKRKLQSAVNPDDVYYIFGEIFDNEYAQDDLDNIVEFFNMGINVFNITEPFFNDLCVHYERNKADYVLEDRIEFFYQNYSLCNSSCNLSQIYMENYSYSCVCWPEVEEDSSHHKKEHSMELDENFSLEGLSQEMSDLFFESNLEVIRCFFVLLKEKIIFYNYGFIITTLLLIIQLFASLFLYNHLNDIRLYVFRDLIKCKFNPPLRRGYTMEEKGGIGKNNNNRNLDSRTKSLRRADTRKTNANTIISNVTYERNYNRINKKLGTELSSIKGIIPIESPNIQKANKIRDVDIFNDSLNINRPYKNSRKFSRRSNKFEYNDSNIKFNESSQRKINIKHKNYEIFNEKNDFSNDIKYYQKKIKKNYEEDDDYKTNYNISNDFPNLEKKSEKSYNTSNEMKLSENKYSNGTILTRNSKNKNEKDYSERQNTNRNKNGKDYILPYEEMDYDNDDLDELDYDEALIYDKRTFCDLFCNELKDRQLIANTFWVKDKLKPFSIKLIVFIFNISCYLVINGFLFSEEYVMKILRRTSKGFYYFLVDSTKRIVYSSVIGIVINIIVGILFRADKSIRKVQSKYGDNPIILHGEIVKIYKSTKNLYIVFTIFNCFAMVIFIYYLFCFCGVYRNCQADWFEGCFIVIFLMNILPVFVCLFLACLRKLGLVCKMECLFKINSWIIENI